MARLSQGLAEGFERWWVEGDGGLFYPNFRPANAGLLAGLDAGWLRLPADWLERHADWPIPRDPPAATGGVQIRLDVLAQDERALYVSGVANAGGMRDQEVELVLRAGKRALVFPAHSVPRADLEEASPEVAASLFGTGFRALVPKQALPAGRYTLGILVRHAGRERLSYRRPPIEITGP